MLSLRDQKNDTFHVLLSKNKNQLCVCFQLSNFFFIIILNEHIFLLEVI